MSELTKRPEKLASAVYLITSFFDDREPIKWKLRALSAELISHGLLIKDNLFREQEVTIKKIRNLILEIASLLSVANNIGIISIANFDLMQAELTKYVDMFDYPTNISKLFIAGPSEPKTKELSTDLSIKDKNELKSPEKKPLLELELGQKERPLKEFGAVSVKKNSRQSIIIAILKRKKEIMIKDVSPLISGCSEKTIQRELMSMVLSGVLRKMGEKRWSRYTLA